MSSEGCLKISPNFTKHSKVPEALVNGRLGGSKIKQDTVGGGRGREQRLLPSLWPRNRDGAVRNDYKIHHLPAGDWKLVR